MIKCSNAHMFKCSNAQMLECLNAHILKCSNAQMLKCSNAQMPKCSYSQMLKCSNAHLKTSRMLWDRHQPPVKLQGEKVIGCSFWSFHYHRYHRDLHCRNHHDHHHHQLPVEVCLGGGGHEVVAAPWLELHLLRWGGEAPETKVLKIYPLVVELLALKLM